MVTCFALALLCARAGAATDPREIKAREDFVGGRYQEALDLFAKLYAETLHPNYLRNIGRCYQNLGEPDQAITSFRDYLRKGKDISPAEHAEIDGYIAEMEALKRQRAAASESPPAAEHPAPVVPLPSAGNSKPSSAAPAPVVIVEPAPAPRERGAHAAVRALVVLGSDCRSGGGRCRRGGGRRGVHQNAGCFLPNGCGVHMSLVARFRSVLGGRAAFPLLWAAVVVTSGASCTEKGRSLVPAHITADQTVPSSLHQVQAIVTQAAATLGEADWPAGQPSAVVDLGVYLPKSVSGTVDVVACGFDASGNPVAVSGTRNRRPWQPGATSPQVNLVLSTGTPSALCAIVLGTGGTTGTGGSGTGGAAGATASGGYRRKHGRQRRPGRQRQRRPGRQRQRRRRRQGERRHRGQRQRRRGGQGERRNRRIQQAARRAPVEPAARRSSGRGTARWASAAPRPPLR